MYKAIKYYVSDHALRGLLLHTAGCEQLPPLDSRAFIGSMYSHNQAMTVASTQYANVRYCPCCMGDKKMVEALQVVKAKATVPVLCKATKPKRKKVVKTYEPVRHFPI